MACCKCCCGNKDCAEGEIGKCCCGGPTGTCCQADEYCCEGECQSTPCTGACCDPVFGCTQAADEETCTGDGGTWLGYGVSCDPNPCPGACCDMVFDRCDQETQADCEENGRTFLGVGVPCIPDPCNVDGACCCPDGGNFNTGECQNLTRDECFDGTYFNIPPEPCGLTDSLTFYPGATCPDGEGSAACPDDPP